MYENPYMGNPYMQNRYYGQQYQPVQQQTIQQPVAQLVGRPVDKQESIQASDVPMNGVASAVMAGATTAVEHYRDTLHRQTSREDSIHQTSLENWTESQTVSVMGSMP